MSMKTESPSPIDDEIDDVARSMTAAPPSAALRVAIRARITGPASVSRTWPRWSIRIAAAAAMIVFAIVWADREARIDVPASSRESVATNVSPGAPELSIEPRLTEPGSVVGGALLGLPGEPNRVRPTNEESIPDGLLASVGPLVVQPLEDLDPLGLNGMEIPTLTVEAMTVAPLSQQQ
jgi:hypothetical protein